VVGIPRITVVLNGADNDKKAFQTAVRMAAREKAAVRVVLGPGCSREMFEKHLHFMLWDVKARLGLPAPTVDVETRLDVVDLQTVEASDERVASHHDS